VPFSLNERRGATEENSARSVQALKLVTQVGGVLGSPPFGVPYAADDGRRVELGLRYAF